MVRSFQDVVAQAQPGEKSAWRAVQTWQILVCRASLHHIITYGELAELLGYTDARPLAVILGHILYYCQQHDLPPLTSLVVNQETGLPGAGIGMEAESIPAKHMKVFQYNWFEVVPPSMEDLRLAYATGAGREAS